MEIINHFELNRPVHLARRDVYFENASDLLFIQEHRNYEPYLRSADYEEILFSLRISCEHARYSINHPDTSGKDEQFSHFVNLLAGNVKAVLSMINLKGMVEDARDSSFGFLGVNEASAGLQAEEYQRRANDILRSIQSTLNLAEVPFSELKQENRAASTEDENMRYEKARDHFMALVKDGRYSRIPARVYEFMCC